MRYVWSDGNGNYRGAEEIEDVLQARDLLLPSIIRLIGRETLNKLELVFRERGPSDFDLGSLGDALNLGLRIQCRDEAVRLDEPWISNDLELREYRFVWAAAKNQVLIWR